MPLYSCHRIADRPRLSIFAQFGNPPEGRLSCFPGYSAPCLQRKPEASERLIPGPYRFLRPPGRADLQVDIRGADLTSRRPGSLFLRGRPISMISRGNLDLTPRALVYKAMRLLIIWSRLIQRYRLDALSLLECHSPAKSPLGQTIAPGSIVCWPSSTRI